MSNPVYQTKPLKQVAYYSKERIDSSLLNKENYIGTDNLLQNKQGKQKSTYVPKDGTVTKYNPNDTLVANIRPYLKKIWFANGSGGASSDVLTFKVKSGYDPRFFYYSIFRDEFFDHMMLGSKGTRMPRGSKIQILEYPVPDIELEEQGKIAKTLSLLDSKIELNNRISHELEAAAKTIYDYWFVQFDFPDENGKPYKSSGGKMTWNEGLRRNIPEGWEVKRLDEIEKNIVTGKTPSSKDKSNFDGEIPFICIGDVRGNMHIVDTETKLTRKGAESQKNKYIPAGSICVTCIASPGLVGLATKESQTNQQLNSIICQNSENRYYLYFYLRDYFKYAKAKTGNTFANMNKEDFSSILVLRPKISVLEFFTEQINPCISNVLINSEENQKLAELRDWLLPMLMNGQIMVKEDEN